jgi:hypothetical protein
MGARKGDLIDHVDRDTLDCRKVNLRKVNKSINALNVEVTAHRRKNKWSARVKRDGKYVHLGVYETHGEAVAVKQSYLKKVGVKR